MIAVLGSLLVGAILAMQVAFLVADPSPLGAAFVVITAASFLVTLIALARMP